MSDYREQQERKRQAALQRQLERLRQQQAQEVQAILNLPPPGPERLAELERRHAQARDREAPATSQLADALRKARREEQLRLARQAELDELFPPHLCHLCHQPCSFGFGPPGWPKPFFACAAHRPPSIEYRRQPGELTGAQLMAQLMRPR